MTEPGRANFTAKTFRAEKNGPPEGKAGTPPTLRNCCFDGGFGGAERGHHYDGQLWLGGMELGDQFQAGQARHPQIGEHDIEMMLSGAGQAVIAARGHSNLVAFGLQIFLERRRNGGVVFDQ